MKMNLAIPTSVFFGLSLFSCRETIQEKKVLAKHSTEESSCVLSSDTLRSTFIPNWKFSPEINRILCTLLANDSGNSSFFIIPDSSNTRVIDISTDTNAVYLIETSAGSMMTGSCGDYIAVVRARNSLLETLFSDCGSIDSVFEIAHNGLHDFTLNYRYYYSLVPLFYRYDGEKFVEYKDPKPDDPYTMIQRAILEEKNEDYIGGDSIQVQYVDLGSPDFIFAKHTFTGIYLVKENSSRSFTVVNYFEDGWDVNILERKTNGMNDLKISESPYNIGFYQWNGKHYVLISRSGLCAN